MGPGAQDRVEGNRFVQLYIWQRTQKVIFGALGGGALEESARAACSSSVSVYLGSQTWWARAELCSVPKLHDVYGRSSMPVNLRIVGQPK